MADSNMPAPRDLGALHQDLCGILAAIHCANQALGASGCTETSDDGSMALRVLYDAEGHLEALRDSLDTLQMQLRA